MFERLRKYIGPAALVGAAGIGAGIEHARISHEQVATIDNVETVYYQAQPGSIVTLDLKHEIPAYRWSEIEKGETSVGVSCAVLGSLEGDIDSHNIIIPYGKLTEKDITFKLPIPGKEYDGSSGYGYFVICGKEGTFTNKGIEVDGEVVKPDFSVRIVYEVVPNTIKAVRKSFAIK